MKLLWHRLGQGALVLLVVSLLTFGLLSAAGGDALTTLQEDPRVSPQTIADMRRVYGLDQPWPVRYGRWVNGLAHGDLGVSLNQRLPVGVLLWPRLGRTAALSALALLWAWLAAWLIGGWAARRPRSWPDKLCDGLILATSSTPRLALALAVLATLAASGLGNLATGAQTAGGSLQWSRILFPSLVLAVPLIAVFTAQVREGLRTALALDFVRVARAKGLPESTIMRRHALRAALNPLITLSGTAWGNLLSGSLVVESVFDWHGLGGLSVEAVKTRDVPLLLGIVLVTTIFVVLTNLVADILLLVNDPRLRQ